MAFSKDPFFYSPEEQQLFLAALDQHIELDWGDAKLAAHKRHRLYAFRKAIVEKYERGLEEETRGRKPDWMNHPLMVNALLIRGLSIAQPGQGPRLIIGIGATTQSDDEVIRKALAKAGKKSKKEQIEEEARLLEEKLLAQEEGDADAGIRAYLNKPPVTDSSPPPEGTPEFDAWQAEQIRKKVTGEED